MEKKLLMNKTRHAVVHLKALIKKGFLILAILLASHINTKAVNCQNYGNATAENIVYSVNGNTVPTLTGNVSSGDQVKVCFTLSSGSDSTMFSLVSYQAPGASFDASSAHLQTVFSMESSVFYGTGTYCLTVTIPSCYFQLDFVKGCVIYQFGPETSNNFYETQNRLIAGANGGSGMCNCVANANAGADIFLDCNSTQATLSGSTFTHNPTVSWQASNGGNIVSGANTLFPVINTAGKYTLTVYDSLNCAAIDSVMVTGHTNVLTPGIIGTDQNHCGPFKPNELTALVNATSNPGETITYQWLYSLVDTENTYGNPYWHAIPGANSANYSPDSIFVTTYFIRCAKTIGCTFVGYTTEGNIVGIHIYSCCTANANAGSDFSLDCNSTQAMLSGSTTTTNPVIQWTTSDGDIVSGANTLYPVITLAGTYVLTVFDTVHKCSATDTVVVSGHTNVLTPGIIGTDQDHCGPFKPNELTALVNATSNPGETITYQWLYSLVDTENTYGNPYWHAIPGANSAYYSPDSIFVTTYFIRCAKTTGCTFIGYTTEGNIVGIHIYSCCTANANAGSDFSLDCNSTQAMLSGSTTTTNPVIQWTTSNGDIVSGANTLYPVITLAGTYVLTVFDTVHKCSATDTVVVSGHTNVLTPGIIGTDQNHCGPFKPNELTALVNATSNPGETITYQWLYSLVDTENTYGNPYWHAIPGANSANYSPDSIFVTTYFIRCAKTTGCTFIGYTTEGNIVGIHIYSCCTANANAGSDFSLDCNSTQAMLSGSTTTTNPVIQWTTSNGDIVSGANTLYPVITLAGTYVLTVFDTVHKCSATDTVVVSGHTNVLTPGVIGLDQSNCGPFKPATLTAIVPATANQGETITYQWLYSLVDTANTYGNPYWHAIPGANSADYSPDSIFVTTYFIRCAKTTGCTFIGYTTEGNIVGIYVLPELKVDLGNDTTVVFCKGTLTLDAGNPGMKYLWNTGARTETIDVSVSGEYSVTVTNSAGCTASDNIQITVNPEKLVVNLGNDTSFTTCKHDTLLLNAGITDGTYAWSTGSITETTTVTTSGTYYVNVTDSKGCSASDTIKINIIDMTINLNLGRDTTLCGCIVLNASSSEASYKWCSGQDYPAITVCNTGMYCVQVRNGICIASDTINITVMPEPVVHLGKDTTLLSGSLVLNAGNAGASYHWSTGASTQTIVVTTSGMYAVTITDTFGCTASDSIKVTGITGIAANAATDFPLYVYPNPSNDKKVNLSFDVPEKGTVEIRILNQLGLLVHIEKLENFQGTYNKMIGLENFADGIYFIDVLTDNNRSTIKIALN